MNNSVEITMTVKITRFQWDILNALDTRILHFYALQDELHCERELLHDAMDGLIENGFVEKVHAVRRQTMMLDNYHAKLTSLGGYAVFYGQSYPATRG